MGGKYSAQERKSQIIEVALKLFAVKGYEKTSVNTIITEAGISKGGFYHHYASKEDLLQDIAALLIKDIESILKEVEKSDNLTALEKINQYIKVISSYKGEKTIEVSSILTGIYAHGKNVHLESKIYDYAQRNVAPIMKKIILQGVKEGSFKTEFPNEAAETYIKLFIMQQQEITDLFYQAWCEKNQEILRIVHRKYRFFQKLLEDILGLARGSLVVEEVMGKTAEKMIEKILADGKKN